MYWPLPRVPGPVVSLDGGFHSQGCSVHSSHRLREGLPPKEAAGCLPGWHHRDIYQKYTGCLYIKIIYAISRHTHRQTDRQTDRQADRQTGRQTDRQTDRLTDRYTHKQTNREEISKKQWVLIWHIINSCTKQNPSFDIVQNQISMCLCHGKQYVW